MKKLKLLIILISTTLTLNGCYWNTPVIDLISPPRLTSEQAEIFNALTNSKGSALTLKYPKTGEYLSAFVFPEAPTVNTADKVMVFYELSDTSTEPAIWLTFLEKRNERWRCTYDITFFATDIEKVEFSDLGDGNPNSQGNIIISYSILNQPDKNLRVIAFGDNNEPFSVYQRDFCIYYEIDDFDKSGSNMLLSINRSSGEDVTEASVEFAGWRDGRFVTAYNVHANPNATDYVKSVKGILDISETDEESVQPRHVLFLEYSQTDTLCNTGIIVWTEGISPRNIVFTGNETRRSENLALLEKRPNLLTAHAYARDIDGDGVVNVAGNRPFPGYDHASISAADRARAAIWYSVTNDNRFEELYYTYLSVNNDYVFFFPGDWVGDVTVTINHEDNGVVEVIFWEYDYLSYDSVLEVENQLLRIASVPKGDMDITGNLASGETLYDDYTLYNDSNNEQFNYYVKIIDKSMHQRELKKALSIFELK